jgi:hypothetical protein
MPCCPEGFPQWRRRKQAAPTQSFANAWAAQPPKHYAEPTDAQQEQGTTTENYARAEALRRSVSPLHCFSATGYFVSAESEPSRPDRAKKNTNADDLFCLNLCCIFADYVIGNNIFLRRTLKEILYGKIRSQTPL